VGELTASDCDLIIRSLGYTAARFREYDGYPSEEFRQIQIADVESVIKKVRDLKPSDSMTARGTVS
jgi:hypothetical protein